MSRLLLVILTLVAALLAAAAVAINGPEGIASAYRQLDRQLTRASKATAGAREADAAAAMALARDVAAAEALQIALGERVARGEAPDQTALDAASGSLAVRAAAGETERSTLLALVTERGFAESRLGETSRFGEGPRVVAAGEALTGKPAFAYSVIDERFYRVAAAPVGAGERPLGALALGFPLDDEHAARLKEAAGADVTVLRAGKVVASTLPPAERAQIAGAAAAGGMLPFGFGALPPESEKLLGIVPVPFLLHGARGQRGSAEPLPGVEGAELVLSLDATPAIGPALEAEKRAALVPVAILLLGIVLVLLAGDSSPKKIARLADAAEALAGGGDHPVPEDFSGDLGRIARSLNRLAPHVAPQPIDLPGPGALDEAPPPSHGTEVFGSERQEPVLDGPTDPFGGRSAESGLPPLEKTVIAPSGEGPPTYRTEPAPIGERQSWPSALSGLPESFPPVADPPTVIEPPRAAFDPFAGMGTPGPVRSDRDVTIMAGTEGQTVVATVPDALLRATSRVSEGDPDAAHFQEVFREFLDSRRRCGEPVEGIAFDKFSAKLRKNREQLVERYRCRSVRFTVYVKDGKTALKATPVKD